MKMILERGTQSMGVVSWINTSSPHMRRHIASRWIFCSVRDLDHLFPLFPPLHIFDEQNSSASAVQAYR